MIKWIIIAIILFLAVVGGFYIYNNIINIQDSGSNLDNQASPIDDIPDSEFEDLSEDNTLLDEIDNSLDALG